MFYWNLENSELNDTTEHNLCKEHKLCKDKSAIYSEKKFGPVSFKY